jgi:hypothetical protein
VIVVSIDSSGVSTPQCQRDQNRRGNTVNSVFVLHHTARVGKDEDVKLLGVYKTKLDAEAAMAQLKDKPGFRDPGGEWSCVEFELGKIHWSEGFGLN